MPAILFTALPARIKRVTRECEYARVTNAAMLVQRPAAKDGWQNIKEAFFDSQADAQELLDELAAQIVSDRKHEAIETDTPFALGRDLPITPVIPKARCVDTSTGFDRTMLIKAVSIDLYTGRNSIEVLD